VIQTFAPRRCFPVIHSTHRHRECGICIKNFQSRILVGGASVLASLRK
jgi:hypothetical protein